MTRANRLSIGIFAPPIVGAILVSFIHVVDQFDLETGVFEQIIDTFSHIHFVVLGAFILVGIQSICCALIIEFHVLPQKLGRMHFVRVCILLGSLSGQIPGFFLEAMEEFLPIGAVVGAMGGLVIYSNRKSK